MVGKGPGRRLIVIRSAVTTQLSAQRLVGLKAELDGLLALAGYDAEKDRLVIYVDRNRGALTRSTASRLCHRSALTATWPRARVQSGRPSMAWWTRSRW